MLSQLLFLLTKDCDRIGYTAPDSLILPEAPNSRPNAGVRDAQYVNVTKTLFNASIDYDVSEMLRNLVGTLRSKVFHERSLNKSSDYYRYKQLLERHKP